MSEKKIYQVIGDELNSKNVDAALWIQAKAMAEGDSNKTEAAYIRLRFAELKKSLLPPQRSSPLVLSTTEPEAAHQVSELSKMRSELTTKLLVHGKTSLYSTLNLLPNADDNVVAAAIADAESKNLTDGRIANAEFKYAKETLGNPTLREQYDRQLLESISNRPKPINSYAYAEEYYQYSWWESRKTSVIIGVISLALFGYLGLNYLTEHHRSGVQKEAVEVMKDAVQGSSEVELMKVQADIDLKGKTLALAEERQKQELEIRARTTNQMLDQQRAMQEARAQAEQQRLQWEQQRQQTQKDQAENLRIAKEKQYYACMNQQLTVQYSQRDPSNYSASARCSMYR